MDGGSVSPDRGVFPEIFSEGLFWLLAIPLCTPLLECHLRAHQISIGNFMSMDACRTATQIFEEVNLNLLISNFSMRDAVRTQRIY